MIKLTDFFIRVRAREINYINYNESTRETVIKKLENESNSSIIRRSCISFGVVDFVVAEGLFHTFVQHSSG